MSCYECVRKDYCPYIHKFNHDKNVGCVEFQDRDNTTHITSTLNNEIDLGKADGKFDTIYIKIQDWNEIQKKIKALEIIKEKVNLKVIESKDKEIHTLVIENIFNVPISEETYDLLKEVLL